MSLERLLFECTRHYRDRGYPHSALLHLRWTLITNTRDGQIFFHTPYQDCCKRVENLLGHFKPCPPLNGTLDLSAADAVFGFSFGYRMQKWSNHVPPTHPDEVAANRLPGLNNEALAAEAQELHATYKLALYLQFEIADSIGTSVPVKYASRRVDQGTGPVLKEFLEHAGTKGEVIKTAVIVAHRHHYERCRLLTEKLGVRGIPGPTSYSGYDPQEAQPRVMSPEECIVNDFASMAGMN